MHEHEPIADVAESATARRERGGTRPTSDQGAVLRLQQTAGNAATTAAIAQWRPEPLSVQRLPPSFGPEFYVDPKLIPLRAFVQNTANPHIDGLRDNPTDRLVFRIDPAFGLDLANVGRRPNATRDGTDWVVSIRDWLVRRYDVPVLVAEIVHEVGAHVLPAYLHPEDVGGDPAPGRTSEQADHLRMRYSDAQNMLAREMARQLANAAPGAPGLARAREMLVAYLLDMSTIGESGDRIKVPLRPARIAATYQQIRRQPSMGWMGPPYNVPQTISAADIVGRYAALYWKVISSAVGSLVPSWLAR